MINRFRTLLLNRDGSDSPARTFPGEETVPGDFRSVRLSGTLSVLRDNLFGAGPDRAKLNYRLREIMGILHASKELEEYVTDLDSRITYLPFNNDLFDRLAAVAVAAPQNDTDKEFVFVSNKGVVESQNRLYYEWKITVISSSEIQIDYYSPSIGGLTGVTQTYTASGLQSEILTLPESTLKYQFELGTGSVWIVTALARPRLSLTQVVANVYSLMNEQKESDLFGGGSSEPYATFRNLWHYHPSFPYRFGGLILAYGYRINELVA